MRFFIARFVVVLLILLVLTSYVAPDVSRLIRKRWNGAADATIWNAKYWKNGRR